MSHPGRISGWLFFDPESNTTIFVSRSGRADETGLPWDLLRETGTLDAFRKDFSFEEVALAGFFRFKIDIEEQSLRRWFSIREDPS